MKRDLIQCGIEVGVILAVSFLALTFGGGCSSPMPNEVQPIPHMTWIPALDSGGNQVMDTIPCDDPASISEGHVWWVKGRYVTVEPQGTYMVSRFGAIHDPYRDTTAY